MPGGWARLEQLPQADEVAAQAIVGEILWAACRSSHSTTIAIGRKAMARIPIAWLDNVLPEMMTRTLDLTDDWEYSRLLELLKSLNSPLLPQYLKLGQESTNPDLREVAGWHAKP